MTLIVKYLSMVVVSNVTKDTLSSIIHVQLGMLFVEQQMHKEDVLVVTMDTLLFKETVQLQ